MIEWLEPSKCIPPHRITRPWQVDEMADLFSQHGWGVGYPNLAGYREPDGKVQLLTGTHRHAAATRTDIKVPVHVHEYAQVAAAWGDCDAWIRLIQV